MSGRPGQARAMTTTRTTGHILYATPPWRQPAVLSSTAYGTGTGGRKHQEDRFQGLPRPASRSARTLPGARPLLLGAGSLLHKFHPLASEARPGKLGGGLTRKLLGPPSSQEPPSWGAVEDRNRPSESPDGRKLQKHLPRVPRVPDRQPEDVYDRGAERCKPATDQTRGLLMPSPPAKASF